jgi:predicted deacylase
MNKATPKNAKAVLATRTLMLVATSLLFASFFWSPSLYALNCEFEKLSIKSDFDGARVDACEKLTVQGITNNDALDHYQISVLPENSPINPSPWYAFAISSKSGEQDIRMSIVAQNASPRYIPKISVDGLNWKSLDFTVDDKTLHFNLRLNEQKVFVAAQELITQTHYTDWQQQEAIVKTFHVEQVGTSTEGKVIEGLIAKQTDNEEWLLILGRQHPPEITGALALFAFVEKLSQESELQRAFLNRFNILVVPLVNPDGVANGNWRHNSNGIDLNRDWGKFTQAETRSIYEYFEKQLVAQQRLVFALDFHSTQQDIFYTMPTDYGLVPSDFSQSWLEDLKAARLGSFTVRERPGSSPGRGVFKQFIADHYGLHSVTYEMGDNTNRSMIKHIAEKSAELLMKKMLATPPEAFIPTKTLQEGDASQASNGN